MMSATPLPFPSLPTQRSLVRSFNVVLVCIQFFFSPVLAAFFPVSRCLSCRPRTSSLLSVHVVILLSADVEKSDEKDGETH